MLRSLSYDTKKCDTQVQYNSFFHLLIRWKQHVRETTSEVNENDVGQRTRRRNERKPPLATLRVKGLSTFDVGGFPRRKAG